MPNAAKCKLFIYYAAKQIRNSEHCLVRFLSYVKQA